MRKSWMLLLVVCSCFHAVSAHGQNDDQSFDNSIERARKMAKQVTIFRDPYGVAHVYGPTDESVVFGFTYARAEDEFQKIQKSLLVATGRLSESLGMAAMMSDRAVRFFEIPTHAQNDYEKCSGDFRNVLIAYADALNYFRHKNPDKGPFVIEYFEPWHALAAGRTMNIGMLNLSPEYRELMNAAAKATPDPSLLERPRPEDERDGSNMWAIGPGRTTTGNAMLFINPHIPLNELYEGHLCSENGLNISGGFAYGSFLFPFAGHNENLGWSLTVNYPDVIDVYVEEFNPENPDQYRYDGEWKNTITWDDTINVKQVDGTMRSVPLKCTKTQHGPVFFRVGNQGYAIAVSKIEQGGFPQQLYAMAKSQNIKQFKSAVAQCSLVFHNVMYADIKGNTWYVYNCASPRRNPNVDWSKPVSGESAENDWNGYHSIDELPQVLNPKSGWMQNCNSSPFSTTAASDNPSRDDFPRYIAREDRDNNRVRISRFLLESKPKFSFQDLIELAWDTRVLEAQTWVPFLETAFKNFPEMKKAKGPISELVTWNQRVEKDSIGATLFHLWYERVAVLIRQNRLEQKEALEELLEVANSLERDFGKWSVAYGEVFRHQRPGPDGNINPNTGNSWPVSGGHPQVGMINTFLSRKVNDSKQRFGFHGHSYVSVIEFDSDGIKAKSVVPFGQSSDPKSRHFQDQAELYANGQFKPAYFKKSEIAKVAIQRYRPGEKKGD